MTKERRMIATNVLLTEEQHKVIRKLMIRDKVSKGEVIRTALIQYFNVRSLKV